MVRESQGRTSRSFPQVKLSQSTTNGHQVSDEAEQDDLSDDEAPYKTNSNGAAAKGSTAHSRKRARANTRGETVKRESIGKGKGKATSQDQGIGIDEEDVSEEIDVKKDEPSTTLPTHVTLPRDKDG
jgi:hypothetical protein